MPALTAGALTGAATVLLSLALLYIPGLNTWFAAKPKATQQGFMVLLTLAVAIAAVASSCLNLWVFVECTQGGIMQIVQVFIGAILGLATNQGVYQALPQSMAVLAVRAARMDSASKLARKV
jgi:hypothetical protein